MEVRERTKRLLEKAGRITPREVLEAYRETGFAAVRHKWAWKDEACALTALGVAHDPGPIPYAENTADEANVRDMALAYVESRMPYTYRHYAFGFERGFDGELCPKPGDDDRPLVRGSKAWERCGWRDGRRTAWAVFDHQQHEREERGMSTKHKYLIESIEGEVPDGAVVGGVLVSEGHDPKLHEPRRVFANDKCKIVTVNAGEYRDAIIWPRRA